MRKQSRISINSSAGGNGDVWMRLVSFYAIAGLLPKLKIEVLVPPFLRNLAEYTFGDRLVILKNESNVEYLFTSLGLKGMICGICSGKKYIAPYHRSVIHDKGEKNIKDLLNIILFYVADILGFVQVPAWKWIKVYQGYLDIIGIKKLRHITYRQYETQLQADFQTIYSRLNENIPVSPELVIPEILKDNVVVFPTGTSRQFIPVWWAKKYLPNAYYAFFFKDNDAKEFEVNGLKVIHFYKEPGDVIALSHAAKWTVTTDSFPSHLLQYATKRCSVTITEVLKSRIISPVFKGKVIDNQVDCHPCLHLERKKHVKCMAGHFDCLNWSNEIYSNGIINSITL